MMRKHMPLPPHMPPMPVSRCDVGTCAGAVLRQDEQHQAVVASGGMCGMCGMCFVNGEVVVRIMPFGKYRGRSLASIPGSYLFWCLEEADLRPDLHGAIQAELV